MTRSSASWHADKIHHSYKLSLIDFHRESKVEYLVVDDFLCRRELVTFFCYLARES